MGDLLLPTTVVGSHAYPSWFWTALQEIEHLREFCGAREVGLGVVDIKSFYVLRRMVEATPLVRHELAG